MNIRPIRNVNEYDIIPFFGFSGASANKGTFVTPQGSGLDLTQAMTLGDLSNVAGTVSSYFRVSNTVIAAASGALKHQVLGCLLYDHRAVDENGERLIFNPRKAAEMEVTVSGQACPVLAKGILLYSGIVGDPAFGSGAAIADAGDGSLKVVSPTVSVSGISSPNPACIGSFLGRLNSEGYAYLKFDCQV